MSFMSLGVLDKLNMFCLFLWVFVIIDNFTIPLTSARCVKYMYVYLPQFETGSTILPQLSRMVNNLVHVCYYIYHSVMVILVQGNEIGVDL